MEFEVRESLTQAEFIEHYVTQNKPLIVKNIDFVAEQWQPEALSQRIGEEAVQVYDALFSLQEVATLTDYLEDHFGLGGRYRDNVPYIRWYNRLKDVDFVWSDEAFAALSRYWKAPAFLPQTNLLVPFTQDGKRGDPVTDLFPYRGILVAARGARTRTHTDPFCSDAIVCQFYGQKEVAFYHPSRAAELSLQQGLEHSFGGFIDVREKNLNQLSIEPDYHGFLNPGDMVYVPHGWIHDVIVTQDSVSVTWNFVHERGALEYVDYLLNNPANDSEFEILKFFYAQAGYDFQQPNDILETFSDQFAQIKKRASNGHESADLKC